jgi:hypothetical protein
VGDYQPDEVDYLRAVGEGVRIRRLAAGLAQRELADLAGMDRMYLGQIERAQHGLKIIPLRRIGEALGVSLHDLLLCDLSDGEPIVYRGSGKTRPGHLPPRSAVHVADSTAGGTGGGCPPGPAIC